MPSPAARLRDAVEVLALPGKAAVLRMPPGRPLPDEMAYQFDEGYTAYVASLSELPAEEVLVTLQQLDDALNKLSDPTFRELWTEAALVSHPCWQRVRELAATAKRALECDAQGQRGASS